MSEVIHKLQPDRTIHLRGFDRRGSAAALHHASPTGFEVTGVFRDQAWASPARSTARGCPARCSATVSPEPSRCEQQTLATSGQAFRSTGHSEMRPDEVRLAPGT